MFSGNSLRPRNCVWRSCECNEIKGKFAKGYEQIFSTEILPVHKVIQRLSQPIHEISDLQDRPV